MKKLIKSHKLKKHVNKTYRLIFILVFLTSCTQTVNSNYSNVSNAENDHQFHANTTISDVITYPGFETFGRLIFPSDQRYYSGNTLEDVSLTWYGNINSENTVEVINYMKNQVDGNNTIFYDIYTDEEKILDPSKENTGLFYFKGNPNEKFAILNAGGGFAYVGALHDSFHHALELSKMGYNAFALIYRPDALLASEDLARAIAYVFKHEACRYFRSKYK